MKKIISLSILCLFVAIAIAGQLTIQVVTVTAGGGNPTVPSTSMPDYIDVQHGGITLSGNVNLSFSSGTPPNGRSWVLFNPAGINLNGNSVFFFGQGFTQAQLDYASYFTFTVVGGVVKVTRQSALNTTCGSLDGCTIDAGTLPVNSITPGSSAQVLVADGSGDWTGTNITGDIGITNAGVTSISAGVIVNADINASAAIARTKVASGTANHVIINDGSGVLSSEATLAVSRGGTGLTTAASTGFPVIAAGTWSVGTIAESMNFTVGFDSSALGDYRGSNKVKMPCAGTITGLYSYAQTAVSGADAGTIVAKNAAGTTMTTGTITYSAADPRGTAYSVTPSANNTFSAGDIIDFVTTKPSQGGKVLLTVTYTRSN